MRVEYRTQKDLPCSELYQLFLAVGWAKSSEWLVQTDLAKGFYEKIGFKENKDYFLRIPCKYF